ncbi:MAG: 16S rRNA (guanine(966)-N(2))-methyltransferase RsmD [Candidatus Omnitrophica bacterium]|nr:16S rRNA (guanine(966)-N(2))-methyltransferase RsmD [Candidatus Omnitrophota bacterium]
MASLRILAGEYKGALLLTPPGIRPTESRVRKALFDILGPRIEGSRVLELYAGSGALGLEALSRGAASVDFVESQSSCIQFIRKNLQKVLGEKALGCARIHPHSAEIVLPKLGNRGEQFDLILMDPPYRKGWAKKSLQQIGACAILRNLGVAAVQHAWAEVVPESEGNLVKTRDYRYGDTGITCYATQGSLSGDI